ncbi:hypothetical protein EDC01DRAFT_662836 [Geopyxis carbonaria]|nr:hypothetical protein EDC01DRAFT_662836 [Geopyxis carbonaria]
MASPNASNCQMSRPTSLPMLPWYFTLLLTVCFLYPARPRNSPKARADAVLCPSFLARGLPVQLCRVDTLAACRPILIHRLSGIQ